MKIKCPQCNAKVSSDNCECPKCGYTIYSNEFQNIAGEMELEMSRVTEAQLIKAAGEAYSYNSENKKMTYDEFKAAYIKKHKIKMRRSANEINLILNLHHEHEINQAYEEYLRGIRSDF